jgi:hypothetical protein
MAGRLGLFNEATSAWRTCSVTGGVVCWCLVPPPHPAATAAAERASSAASARSIRTIISTPALDEKRRHESRAIRNITLVEREEFIAFRAELRRSGRLIWPCILAISTGAAVAATYAWTLGIGVVIGSALLIAGTEAYVVWGKRRWIGRFPELSDADVTWRRLPPS